MNVLVLSLFTLCTNRPTVFICSLLSYYVIAVGSDYSSIYASGSNVSHFLTEDVQSGSRLNAQISMKLILLDHRCKVKPIVLRKLRSLKTAFWVNMRTLLCQSTNLKMC